jgi:hypothetical protein
MYIKEGGIVDNGGLDGRRRGYMKGDKEGETWRCGEKGKEYKSMMEVNCLGTGRRGYEERWEPGLGADRSSVS